MLKKTKSLLATSLLALAIAGPASLPAIQAAAAETVSSEQFQRVHFRSMQIDGVRIAYREAGSPDRPTVLLLHGFPTSSHMFRNLIPALAERYHVIAPDYPGFGASDMPPADDFEYSFAKIAAMTTELLDRN
ncbi:MAG: alpha/beta fold hydrolase, partial [Rhizobiaceae bacterium]